MDQQNPNIDKKDRLIMQQLEVNPRLSYKEMGKKVGLKGDTVEYRINKMSKSGIISRMFAELNLSKIGLKTYRLYLKIENMNKVKEQEFINYVISTPKAQWYAEFEGEWDYTIRYAVINEMEFKEELDKLMSKFGQFVRAKDIIISIYQTYLYVSYLTDNERRLGRIKQVSSQAIEKLDYFDKKILYYLISDGRTKSTEMAKKLKISPDAVQYRIKKLINRGTISNFTTWFDRRKLGYGYYKILVWLQFATIESEINLTNYCEQHLNVVFINRVLGNWDLEIDFDARNPEEIHEFIKDLKNAFPNIIRDHTTLSILTDKVLNPFRAINKL